MSEAFCAKPTAIKGVHLIERHLRGDGRGFLARLFSADEFASLGWGGAIAQINHTYTSTEGTIRGLHFQLPPRAEKKLVICLRGAVCDVAVDLRQGSPTFLQHHKEILSADKHQAMLIPEGCAHGFQTLSDDVELVYLHSERYSPEYEGGVSVFEPMLAITWPKPAGVISDRDRNHTPLTSNYEGLLL
jgi:dTDP-4-dehydrorhamnose 3,5-epimerase